MKNLTFNLEAESTNCQSLDFRTTRLRLIRLFAFLSIFLTGLSSSAQELKEMGKTLAAMKSSPDSTVVREAMHLENLVYELNPYVIIREGIFSTYADAPFVCVDIDAQSVNKLKEPNILFDQAELLTVRINTQNDLNILLDLASLNGFSKLKYINFLCSIDCTREHVSKLIKMSKTGINVLYLISIPS
ncbi:MAG: hypothetical protein ACOYMF_15150 [Bacteroidales bacterium]